MTIDLLRAALADRYRIERELGQGGMATVYLAEDLRHQRKVAIKVLKPELAAVLGAERFVQEIKTTAALSHPHILPLFDSGTAASQLYYVMPYLEGETLRERLSRETQLGVDDAVRLTSEVAGALDYAHRHGVVHRDIKPENLLLHDGRAMVMDFGIALAVSAAAGGRMTETGLSLGTPHYMSPEQATADKEITGRSDIYSLGSVLYEMLTGNPPHTGSSAQQVIMKIVAEEVAPVTTLRKSVPSNVAAALSKALQKLPADRFASAHAFAAALGDPHYTDPTQHIGAGPAATSWWRRVALGAGACAVALGVLAAWGWWRSESAPSPPSRWRTLLTLSDSVVSVSDMSMSPDGNTLAFVARGPQGDLLWVRDAASPEPRSLPHTTGASSPIFSPDGQYIAYQGPGGKAAFVVRPDGSGMLLVTDSLKNGQLTGWSDDQHLLFSTPTGLMQVPVHGGPWQNLTTVDSTAGEAAHYDPQVLPGNSAIVFTIMPRKTEDLAQFHIAVTRPGAQHHAILMSGFLARYVAPGYLLVLQTDGTWVAVPFDPRRGRLTGAPLPVAWPRMANVGEYFSLATSASGRIVYSTHSVVEYTVVRVAPNGAATAIDSSWHGYGFASVAVSPDGHTVAIGTEIGNAVDPVQLRDLRTGAMSTLAVPGATVRYPVFTPDGSALILADAALAGGFWEADLAHASPPRVLVRSTGLVFDPAIAPDGRTLYYASRLGNNADIIARPLHDSTATARPLVATPAGEYAPQPSPDGRWLAYYSEDPDGVHNIYVRSTDPARAERWKISHGESNAPRWSRDGRELYYLSRDSLIAVAVSSGATFAAGAQHALFATTTFRTRYRDAYDVLPGGGFVMLQDRDAKGGASTLVMIDDWRSLLPDSVWQRH